MFARGLLLVTGWDGGYMCMTVYKGRGRGRSRYVWICAHSGVQVVTRVAG